VFGAASAAATKAEAKEAAAAWAPAATSASIASYGVAAGTGVIAYLAALGVGTAGAVAASAGGAFESGGWTGGREGQFAGFVHGEEVVFPAPRVRELGRDYLVNMALGSISKPSYERGGFVGDYSASGAQQTPEIHIFNFTDPDKLRRAVMESDAAKKIIIDTVRGRRIDLGFA